jgi:hypothetical protein
MLRGIHEAAELAIRQGLPAGLAIGTGLRAVVAPLPPGTAGGLAQARNAWRHWNGTFMPGSEKFKSIDKSTSATPRAVGLAPLSLNAHLMEPFSQNKKPPEKEA